MHEAVEVIGEAEKWLGIAKQRLAGVDASDMTREID